MALLQTWFAEQADDGRSLGDLYERVQWAGNVLPRLCASFTPSAETTLVHHLHHALSAFAQLGRCTDLNASTHSRQSAVSACRFLLCAVGACYIRSKEAAARDILRDLVEMCKGVRFPPSLILPPAVQTGMRLCWGDCCRCCCCCLPLRQLTDTRYKRKHICCYHMYTGRLQSLRAIGRA